jgi:hypothetical protein
MPIAGLREPGINLGFSLASNRCSHRYFDRDQHPCYRDPSRPIWILRIDGCSRSRRPAKHRTAT